MASIHNLQIDWNMQNSRQKTLKSPKDSIFLGGWVVYYCTNHTCIQGYKTENVVHVLLNYLLFRELRQTEV